MFLSTTQTIITDESTLLDRLKLGGQTMLIGMVVVFSMLFVIYLAMIAMQKILVRKGGKPKRHVVPAAPAALDMAKAPVNEALDKTDDTAVIAAITAAIAAFTGDAPSSFRVVSFKKRV